jgi:hypothetical protein
LVRELARYKLDLVGVQVEQGGTVRTGDYFFSMEYNENHQFGTGILVQHRILSAFKRGKFISFRTSVALL